jgi:hypothetical protein
MALWAIRLLRLLVLLLLLHMDATPLLCNIIIIVKSAEPTKGGRLELDGEFIPMGLIRGRKMTALENGGSLRFSRSNGQDGKLETMPPSNTRQQRQIRTTSSTSTSTAGGGDSGFRRGFLLASSSSSPLNNAPRATKSGAKDGKCNYPSGLRRGFLISRTLPSPPPPPPAKRRDKDASIPSRTLHVASSTSNDSIGKIDSMARVGEQTISNDKITSPELLTLETTNKPSHYHREPWWVFAAAAAAPPAHDAAAGNATEPTRRSSMIMSVIDDENDDHGKQPADTAVTATDTTTEDYSPTRGMTPAVSLLLGNVAATNEMEESKSGLLLTEVISASRQESPRPDDVGTVHAGNAVVLQKDASHSKLGEAKRVSDPRTATSDVMKSLSINCLPSPDGSSTRDTLRAARQSIDSTIRQLRRVRKRTWRTIGQTLVLDGTNDESTSLALWQAMVDAILESVNHGAGGSTIRTPETELWLGEYLLKQWLSTTTNESTPWSRFLFVSHCTTTDPSVATNHSNSLEVKVQRRHQLVVANLLHVWLGRCCEQHEHPNDEVTLPQVYSLVRNVFPRLIDDALMKFTREEGNMSPPRKVHQPTVLEQKVLEVVYRIVVLAANTIVWANDTVVDAAIVAKIGDFHWSQSPMLINLLEAQQPWLSCSGTGSIPAQSDDSVTRSNIRTMCRAAIVNDWIQLYHDCRDGNVQAWCQLLVGHQLGHEPGSFGYTVAGVGQELPKSDILSWSTLEQESHSTTDLHQMGRTRSYMRGLLAWISRRSKHWSSLETNDVLSLSWWILEAMPVFKNQSVNSLSLMAL